MVDVSHPQLSIVRQCALLQISRSGHYYQPVGESEPTLALMRLIDEAFLDCPYYGSRQMTRHLHRLGHRVGRNRVVRVQRQSGWLSAAIRMVIAGADWRRGVALP